MAGFDASEFDLNPPQTAYSVEEATEVISRIHRYLESLEDTRLKLKWYIGYVLVHADSSQTSRKSLVPAVSKLLWERHRIHTDQSMLYECERLHVVFEGSYRRFERWIDEREAILNRPIYWKDVQMVCLRGTSTPSILSLLAQDTEASVPRSAAYLRYVGTHDCVVCGRTAEPHTAIGEPDVGVKPSDFAVIPLCNLHEAELRRRGRESFQHRHRVNLSEVAFNLLHRHITGQWVTMWL